MTPWLITIIGSGLGGGLLVLHGFAKVKENAEHMLTSYEQLLSKAREKRLSKEGDEPGVVKQADRAD